MLYDDYHKGRNYKKFQDGGMKKAASPKNDEAAKFCPLGTIQFCTLLTRLDITCQKLLPELPQVLRSAL